MNGKIIQAGVISVFLMVMAGCASKPPQSAAQAVMPAPAVAETKPAVSPVVDPNAGSADALKFKMENWAREMGPMLDKRKKGEPSVADFVDPEQFRLGPTETKPTGKPETPVQVVPIANPTVVATPSISNQVASLNGAEQAGPAIAANFPRNISDGNATRTTPRVSKSVTPTAGDLDIGLSRNIKDNPKDVWAHLDYQLLQFLKDKPTPQLDVLASLNTEDRELITAVMDGLSNFRNGIRSDSNMLVSKKVRPLLDLADRVRAQADLIIPALALCTRVDGFGVYEPVEPARFTAMKEHPIIVYCEVENFASQLTERKTWQTKLSQEVVLYTETGLPVWQDKTENIADQARNRRHDFFVVKKTKFPANITIGRYLLKVTIVDQQASRVAEATMPVVFVAQ